MAGMNTRLWEDTWLGDNPLAEQYPSLYNIAHRTNVSVSEVMSTIQLNKGFRRALMGNKRERWLHLVQRLMDVHLSSNEKIFKWNPTTTAKFMFNSMYLDMINSHTCFLREYIWKIKVPLKIIVFMWFI